MQELIEVPVSRPRSASQFLSPEFVATKARLETLIHQATAVHVQEDNDDYPIVMRLTDVTDNVE